MQGLPGPHPDEFFQKNGRAIVIDAIIVEL
jgi:hypothetical protein